MRTQDGEALGAGTVPLVVVGLALWIHGLVVGAAAALVVAGVGLALLRWSRDVPVALAGGGLAALLVAVPLAAAGPLGVVSLVALGLLGAGPWVALLGLGLAFWPSALAGALAAVAVVLALVLPDGRVGPMPTWARHVVALAVAVAAFLGASDSWAPLAAYVVGVAVRSVESHPARDRLVPVARDLAFLAGAAAPLGFLFIVLLGKDLGAGMVPLLLIGWGSVALGLLILPAGWGTPVLLSDTGPAGRVWVGVLLAGVIALVATAASGALRDAWGVAGIAWVAVAVASVIGLRRLAAPLGSVRALLWVGVAALAALSIGVHRVWTT